MVPCGSALLRSTPQCIIQVTQNKLQTLPQGVFEGLVNLDVLDLEYNELETLPVDVFRGLNLRFLGLEANSFQTLQVGVFDALSVSLALDLSHNELETLPPALFTNLGEPVAPGFGIQPVAYVTGRWCLQVSPV